jgi:hypothetical protein
MRLGFSERKALAEWVRVFPCDFKKSLPPHPAPANPGFAGLSLRNPLPMGEEF